MGLLAVAQVVCGVALAALLVWQGVGMLRMGGSISSAGWPLLVCGGLGLILVALIMCPGGSHAPSKDVRERLDYEQQQRQLREVDDQLRVVLQATNGTLGETTYDESVCPQLRARCPFDSKCMRDLGRAVYATRNMTPIRDDDAWVRTSDEATVRLKDGERTAGPCVSEFRLGK